MGTRPNIVPPYPNSTLENFSDEAIETFFSPPVDNEDEENDVEEAESQSVRRRPLSAAISESNDRASKKVKRSLEDQLAQALREQKEATMERTRVEEMRVLAQIRHDQDIIRQNDERIRLDREKVEADKMNSQEATVRLWERMGYTDEEIRERIDKLFNFK